VSNTHKGCNLPLPAIDFADRHQKPYLHVSGADSKPPESEVTEFIKQLEIKMLNIMGSREGRGPGIKLWVKQALNRVLVSADCLG
jgi:hypothetical protein